MKCWKSININWNEGEVYLYARFQNYIFANKPNDAHKPKQVTECFIPVSNSIIYIILASYHLSRFNSILLTPLFTNREIVICPIIKHLYIMDEYNTRMMRNRHIKNFSSFSWLETWLWTIHVFCEICFSICTMGADCNNSSSRSLQLSQIKHQKVLCVFVSNC